MMQSFLSFHRITTAMAFIMAGALSTTAFAENKSCSLLTTPYTATYVGSFKGWKIETTQELKKLEKNNWRLSIAANNFLGKIKESSTFAVKNNAIESQHYSYWRNILLKNLNIETDFDWTSRLANTTGNKEGKVALQGGEFDSLGYQLQLRCDLINQAPVMSYPVVDHDEIDKLEFQIIGEEELETSLGKLNTVVVKRVRNNTKRITTLWFAKDLDYMVVKLLQEERKDTEAYLLYINSYKKL